MRKVKVVTKLQCHPEVFWQGMVPISDNCYMAVCRYWEVDISMDEYDHYWDLFLDAVSTAIHRNVPEACDFDHDWFIYSIDPEGDTVNEVNTTEVGGE